MTATARLVALELEAFRGFSAPRRVDLDADVVLMRGDNGSGKTSVADGLLWLLTGAIPRLTDRTKGARKSEDPIVNRYRPGQQARVRLTLAVPGGRRLEFERSGGFTRSTLSAFEDQKSLDNAELLLAQSLGGLSTDQFAHAVRSWGILQQHSIIGVLDSGADLHARLAEVVGLERVTRFAAGARELATRLKSDRKRAEAVLRSLQERRKEVQTRLTEAQAAAAQRADSRDRLPALMASWAAELPGEIEFAQTVTSPEELVALGREADLVAQIARQVADSVAAIHDARSGAVEAVDEVDKQLAALRAKAEHAVQRAPTQVQLANAALGLLGEHCPVCGQAIDEESVRHHLTELLQSAEAEAAAAADAQRAVADAQSRLQRARSAQAQVDAAEQQQHRALQALEEQLGRASWLRVGPAWQTPDKSAALVHELRQVEDRLRVVHSEARNDTDPELARMSAEIEAFTAQVADAQRDLEQITERANRAATLERAARRAAERIVERALQRIGPSFAEVFDRLSPHPTFTELRATQDIYYGKNQVVPQVHDPQRDVSANPLLVFSEGQINVVALSYFLGLALNAGDGALPFMLLDDPLQAMDDVSVLGFADLCRRLREQRQLIVTTHDRRFASLLTRKLAPRLPDSNTLLHEFGAWTEDGPTIAPRPVPFDQVVPLIAEQAA